MSIQLRDLDNFLQAGSLTGLRRKMRKINFKYKVMHIFKDFGNYVDPKGKMVFYTWYEPTVQQLEDEINDDSI